MNSTLKSPANVFSDQGSDGSSRLVPYDDIEANPADYYDISKYEKDFIKNPLRPDADIMELASMALALRNGDFDFYDTDVIQANILSHAQLVAQGAKELDGGEGSASEITPSGDGKDLSRSGPLSGEETEKEEGEEAGQVGRSCVGITPPGNNEGEGDGEGDGEGEDEGEEEGEEGEEKKAGVDDENTEADAERERGRDVDGQDRIMDEGESERESERDDHVENMEADAGEGGREGEDQDMIMDDGDGREGERDHHDENMGGDAEAGGREGEDQDEDKNLEGERECVGKRAREEGDEDENIEGEEEDREVEGRIGSGDETGPPGEDNTKRKSRRDERKPTTAINLVRDSSHVAVSGSIVNGSRGRQTRGTKRKAELEGVRTTRSKVPKLSGNARQPVYRRRKVRRL